MIPLREISRIGKSIETRSRFPVAERKGEWGVMAKWVKVSFWVVNVLELDRGNSCTTLCVY